MIAILRLFFFEILPLYCIITIAVWYLSKFLIFKPPRASYSLNRDILQINTNDGNKIAAIYLYNKQATYTLLISHGNAEDIGYVDPLLRKFYEHGFSVFAYDYPGYGQSTGSANEQSTYAAITAVYYYMRNHLNIPADKIILFGRSLGGAPSIDLATREKVAGVIVESTFTSAFRTLTQIPLLPFDKFNNLTKLKKIYFPILIIHGKKDDVIPFSHGKKLYQHANNPKQFYALEEAGHNNIMLFINHDYWQTIEQFINTIKKKQKKDVTNS